MANIRWFVMTILAALIAVLSLRFYLSAEATDGPMGFHLLHSPIAGYLHFTLSPLALAAGAFQFRKSIRERRPAIHRALGYVYVTSCLLGAISGFVLALYSPSGHIAAVGFALLALGWIATTSAAWHAIRLRRMAEHQRWMIRSYALTFAAVTLRLYLLVAGVIGYGDEPWAYSLIAWICWVPNLLVAEKYLVPPAHPFRASART